MTYSEILDYYTKEYEKFIEMGLSKEDALTLVEKHVKENKQIKKASPYDLINLFAGYDVWKETFASFDKEIDSLMTEVTKCIENYKCKPEKKEEKVNDETPSQCCSSVVEKKEEPKICECVKSMKDGVTEIIADTPKHKEFRVTYPNGYYKYKMLMK